MTHVSRQVWLTMPSPAPFVWDRPQVSDAHVLRLISAAGGYPSPAPLRVTFAAVSPGTSTITTQTDIGCLHGHPACAPGVTGWHVKVTVR